MRPTGRRRGRSTSCSSTGATCGTRRAAARSSTCTGSPRAWPPPACGSGCSARPTAAPPPTRWCAACTSSGGAGGSASTRAAWPTCAGTARGWSSTCRTASRSPARWSPARRSSCCCTTCTASSARSCSGGWSGRPVGGSSRPHKRVEHAIDVVARLRAHHRDLALDVVGEGWWDGRLRAHARERGVDDLVRFHGFVDERTKHELLARAWLHLCPSVKEGWGLVVTEAAGHGVPTVAYRSAGGLRESVLDGRRPAARRSAGAHRVGRGGPPPGADRTWRATALAFGEVLAEALGSDPGGEPA
jgi:hypothetical protein